MTTVGPQRQRTPSTAPAVRPAPLDGLSPAALGDRAAAAVIDATIGAGLMLLVAGIGSVIVLTGIRAGDPGATAAAFLLVPLVTGLAGLAWGIVCTVLQAGSGSIGQRARDLRLADQDSGARIGFGRALVRNMVWCLAGSVLVGYFSPLFDPSPRRQGWHDRVGRAVVVAWPAGRVPASPTGTAANAPTGPRSAPPAVPAPPRLPAAHTIAATAPETTPAVPAPVAVPPPPAPPLPREPEAGTQQPDLAASMMPIARDGIISEVPGITGSASPASRTEPPAAEPFSPPPVPERIPEAADSVGETVVRTPRGALLVWDDGTRFGIHDRMLFGRDPVHEDGATAVAVRDETLSLSKTHFEIGADAEGVWVIDRHSTNGVILVRAGHRAALPPGRRTPVRSGDRLEFGDRSAIVEAAA